ncbi:hypothetical protein GH714_030865 [Hevea brasiliensis]|uniref:Uncharacterized protein n=1 Tax=Hevea brasiliensis TaxID=3981 RepID=A0A6A6NDF8_HEVBR|nr:hypothetical protein GH714_030865 [Hevea brasiliensis]
MYYAFSNATVPASTQATFPHIFAVSKYLQPGSFDLVGTIYHEIDQHHTRAPSTMVPSKLSSLVASSALSQFFWLRLELHFLGSLVFGFMKTKRAPKVEVGTRDASMDEWLQGTAYTQSLSSKSKKKK